MPRHGPYFTMQLSCLPARVKRRRPTSTLPRTGRQQHPRCEKRNVGRERSTRCHATALTTNARKRQGRTGQRRTNSHDMALTKCHNSAHHEHMRKAPLFLFGLILGCGGQVRVEQDQEAHDVVVPSLPDGVCPQEEPATLAQLQTPNGLALGDDKLYFTDLADLYDCNGSVQAIALEGGNPEVLLKGICAPNRIVYANEMVYWLNHSGYVAPNGDLSALDLTNGGLSTLATGLIAPDALAVDERYVYVGADVKAELQSPGRLIRIDRQTKESVELATSPGRVADIAVDDDYVYWASSVGFLNGQPNQDSAAYRVSKQGGAKQLLVDGLAGAYAIARAGAQVFVVHPEAGEILALSPDGAEKSVLASALTYPNDVASDGEKVFVTTWGPPADLFVLQNGTPTAMTKTIGYADQIALGADCIYWTEQYIDDEFHGLVRAMAR